MSEGVVLSGLRVRFGPVLAVQGVDLVVPPGRITVLLGPSGSGKSTVLKSIAGLVAPETGSIALGGRLLFDGEKGVDVPAYDRGLGMVFQNHALWPHLRIWQNVAFPLQRRGFSRREARERAEGVLALVGLADYGERYSAELSGGEAQRVSLARALSYEPELLLLDEPLSSLDAPIRAQMRQEIRTIQERTGMTMLYVTHDRVEAEELGDQLVLMKSGEVVESGRASDLLTSPTTEFAARFLLDAMVLDANLTDDAVHLPGVPPIAIVDPLHDGTACALARDVRIGIPRSAIQLNRADNGAGRIVYRQRWHGLYRYRVELAPDVVWESVQFEEFEPGDRVSVVLRGSQIFALTH